MQHSLYTATLNDYSETACERTLCECDKMLVDNLMKNLASYDPERYIHSYNYKQECKRDNGSGGGGDEVVAVITAFSGPSRPGANDGPTYKSPTNKGQSAALANAQGTAVVCSRPTMPNMDSFQCSATMPSTICAVASIPRRSRFQVAWASASAAAKKCSTGNGANAAPAM